MATANDIMPPHSGAAEKALVDGIIDGLTFDIRVGDVWSADLAPGPVLPWLGWAMSVDDWDLGWSEDRKREVIRGSVALHRIKGTRASIEVALHAMGYGDARVIEDRDLPRLGDDGPLIGGTGWALGDSWVLGPATPHWADYWIEIMVPIDRPSATSIAERLANVVPARCRLRGVTLAGVYYSLGDDLWLIGDDIALGGHYLHEV